MELQQHGPVGHATLVVAGAAGEAPLMARRLAAPLDMDAPLRLTRQAAGRQAPIAYVASPHMCCEQHWRKK